MTQKKDIVRISNNGKLYVNATELFEQKDVQEIVEKIANSSIVKSIKARKKKQQVETA